MLDGPGLSHRYAGAAELEGPAVSSRSRYVGARPTPFAWGTDRLANGADGLVEVEGDSRARYVGALSMSARSCGTSRGMTDDGVELDSERSASLSTAIAREISSGPGPSRSFIDSAEDPSVEDGATGRQAVEEPPTIGTDPTLTASNGLRAFSSVGGGAGGSGDMETEGGNGSILAVLLPLASALFSASASACAGAFWVSRSDRTPRLDDGSMGAVSDKKKYGLTLRTTRCRSTPDPPSLAVVLARCLRCLRLSFSPAQSPNPIAMLMMGTSTIRAQPKGSILMLPSATCPTVMRTDFG